jgi:hypothetical protein
LSNILCIFESKLLLYPSIILIKSQWTDDTANTQKAKPPGSITPKTALAISSTQSLAETNNSLKVLPISSRSRI